MNDFVAEMAWLAFAALLLVGASALLVYSHVLTGVYLVLMALVILASLRCD